MVSALFILAVASLPLATIDLEWCGIWCGDWDTIEVTLASLVYSFPLLGIVFVSSAFALVIPAMSLLARSYGRTVRSLSYVLLGIFAIVSLVSYRLFYGQYTPMPVVNPYMSPSTAHATAIVLHYPFYLILVAESILTIVGVLEWARQPSFLFKLYSPPPPKPLKAKRISAPEIAVPQAERSGLEGSIQSSATVGRPLGVSVLAAYFILLVIAAILSVPLTASITTTTIGLVSTLGLLPTLAPAVATGLGYVWIGQAVNLIVPALVAYGLLKRREWARTIVRVLCALVIVIVSLAMIAGTAILVPVLSLAAAYAPLMGDFLAMVCGIAASAFLVGILLPAGIYWYMDRAHIKAYFTTTNPT